MKDYCVFNDNGIKSEEQIIFWRQIQKEPATISFMTPSGIYLYVENLRNLNVELLGVRQPVTVQHEFYKYYKNNLDAWPEFIDTSDHKTWSLVNNIESINLYFPDYL